MLTPGRLARGDNADLQGRQFLSVVIKDLHLGAARGTPSRAWVREPLLGRMKVTQPVSLEA